MQAANRNIAILSKSIWNFHKSRVLIKLYLYGLVLSVSCFIIHGSGIQCIIVDKWIICLQQEYYTPIAGIILIVTRHLSHYILTTFQKNNILKCVFTSILEYWPHPPYLSWASWCSWSLPHTDCHPCHLPRLQVPEVCCFELCHHNLDSLTVSVYHYLVQWQIYGGAPLGRCWCRLLCAGCLW